MPDVKVTAQGKTEKGGKAGPDFEVSRADALRGLTDNGMGSGRPLAKELLANPSLTSDSANDEALVREFMNFLGDPAVSRSLAAHGHTGKNPPVSGGADHTHAGRGNDGGHDGPALCGDAAPKEGFGTMLRGFLTNVLRKLDGPARDNDRVPIMPALDKPTRHKDKLEGGSNIPSDISKAMEKIEENKAGRAKYDALVNKVAGQVGVPAPFLHAIITDASGYDPKVVSKDGSTGLMQVQPATAAIYDIKDLKDPEQNVLAGAKYLKDMLTKFDGDPELAAAAYFLGPEKAASYQQNPAAAKYVSDIHTLRDLYQPVSTQPIPPRQGKPSTPSETTPPPAPPVHGHASPASSPEHGHASPAPSKPVAPANPPAGTGEGRGNPVLSGSAPKAVLRYKEAIEDAAMRTGIDANLIAAQIWAESRGNPNEKSKNIDGNADVGLMQISQNTYDKYVRGVNRSLPALNVNVPEQNILAGTLELTQKLKDKKGDIRKALNAYVGEGINPKYVPNVMAFYNDMKKGKTPPGSDYY